MSKGGNGPQIHIGKKRGQRHDMYSIGHYSLLLEYLKTTGLWFVIDKSLFAVVGWKDARQPIII